MSASKCVPLFQTLHVTATLAPVEAYQLQRKLEVAGQLPTGNRCTVARSLRYYSPHMDTHEEPERKSSYSGPGTSRNLCRLMQVLWVVCFIFRPMTWGGQPNRVVGGYWIIYAQTHDTGICFTSSTDCTTLIYLGWTSILQGLWIIVTILSIPHIEGPYHTMPTEQP